MRAGALSDEKVGEYLKKHYVATWKRVGTFTLVQTEGKTVARAGGNVATYFCTPDLEVIHGVAGPVDAESFLDDARWAVSVYDAARKKAGNDRDGIAKELRAAHEAASRPKGQECGKVEGVFRVGDCQTTDLLHRTMELRGGVHARALLALTLIGRQSLHGYLAGKEMPKLSEIYAHVFENMLGERLSDAPVGKVEMGNARQRIVTTIRAVQEVAPPDETRRLRSKIEELEKRVKELESKRRDY